MRSVHSFQTAQNAINATSLQPIGKLHQNATANAGRANAITRPLTVSAIAAAASYCSKSQWRHAQTVRPRLLLGIWEGALNRSTQSAQIRQNISNPAVFQPGGIPNHCITKASGTKNA